MLALQLPDGIEPEILCLGAHSDDIEIGVGATVLVLAEKYPRARLTWAVFSASGEREAEARQSADYFTAGFENVNIEVFAFDDGHFPAQVADIKRQFEALKVAAAPDLIFTHYRDDRHQDHRSVSDLTWQTFRNHLILEYEVPKYDGDLGIPNFFQPVTTEHREAKLDALERFFGSQRNKAWFSRETFDAMLRLRGVECNAEHGYAEAFYCRKARF